MFFQSNNSASSHKQNGFTLMELLIVLSLLVIIAGMTIRGYEGIQEGAEASVAEAEMVTLRNALIQFKRDTRELPCQVYRNGDFTPDIVTMTLDFTPLVGFPTDNEYHDWCENVGNQANSALTMLHRYPYDITITPEHIWNPDLARGWNGPYIANQDISDPWGNTYLLLDSELSYGGTYRCEADGAGDYVITSGEYSCLTPNDSGWSAFHTLDASIARIVSLGEDGVYQDVNPVDPCLPANGSDDLVLCIVK